MKVLAKFQDLLKGCDELCPYVAVMTILVDLCPEVSQSDSTGSPDETEPFLIDTVVA